MFKKADLQKKTEAGTAALKAEHNKALAEEFNIWKDKWPERYIAGRVNASCRAGCYDCYIPCKTHLLALGVAHVQEVVGPEIVVRTYRLEHDPLNSRIYFDWDPGPRS